MENPSSYTLTDTPSKDHGVGVKPKLTPAQLRSRSAAREQVLLTWQQRRIQTQVKKQQQKKTEEEQQQPQHHEEQIFIDKAESATSVSLGHVKNTTIGSTSTSTSIPTTSGTTTTTTSNIPFSVCYRMKKTLEQVWRDVPWNKSTAEICRNESILPADTSTSSWKEKNGSTVQWTQPRNERTLSNSASSTRGAASKELFPSVITIFQRSALVRQVRSLQMGFNTTITASTSTTTTQCPPEPETVALIESQVLSVLPAGYDWNRAVQQTASQRSRAFWLLDLATIVRTTVDWKHRYCITSSSARYGTGRVQFLYNLHQSSNTDVILLRVLLQSGIVALATTSKWDLDRARAAVRNVKYQGTTSIYDCTMVGNKPDGYIREWMKWSNQMSDDDGSGGSDEAHPLVVDGPDDLQRVCRCVQRLQKRMRKQKPNSMQSQPDLVQGPSFLLRLTGHKSNEWRSIVTETVTSLREKSCTLVGISVDLSDRANCEAIETLLDFLSTFPDVVSTKLRLDIVNLPFNATAHSIHGTTSRDPDIPQSLVIWWNRLLRERQDVALITVDATQQLVASAGALCTRIIGVRQQERSTTKTEQSITHHPEQTNLPVEEKLTDVERRHYYIDDGCYGSLCSNDMANNTATCPLPLFSRKERESLPLSRESLHSGGCDTGNAHEELELYRTTIWGPTCDGLDQVCKDIMLPAMYRDEWLVFPNLTSRQSEGLGTAFNGFSPPDTCYCVLGYFPNSIGLTRTGSLLPHKQKI